MAPGLIPALERRRLARVPADSTSWRPLALLRPGQEVILIDLSAGGALLESHARMLPGARAELQLFGARRSVLHGRIDRCHVSHLEPLRYRGAIVFDEPHTIEVVPGGWGKPFPPLITQP